VFGVQFHPEKRRDAGLQIISNFSMLSKRIIACLDVRDGQVVKGGAVSAARHAGSGGARPPLQVEGLTRSWCSDITATMEGARRSPGPAAGSGARFFLPLAVRGGIRSRPMRRP